MCASASSLGRGLCEKGRTRTPRGAAGDRPSLREVPAANEVRVRGAAAGTSPPFRTKVPNRSRVDFVSSDPLGPIRWGAVLMLLLLVACAPQPPQPQTVGPAPPPDCGIPGDAANLPAITSATTGGVFRAPTAGFTLPGGTTLTLTSSLTIIVRDELRIDGVILLGTPAVAGGLINVTLVSTNADVRIAGVVGRCGPFQPNPPPAAAAVITGSAALAVAVAGDSAGFVKVVAAGGSVDVTGCVIAGHGNWGGSATALGVRAPGLFAVSGSATAVGGGGGAGGEVLLCALEAVHVGPSGFGFGPRGLVSGGWGGGGGHAKATSVNREEAHAIGGPGNRGGNVVVKGLQPGCQLFNEGVLRGGGVLFGSFADATGTLAGGVFDGDARAEGGPGGQGGSVFASDCPAVRPGTIAVAAGGNGGPADARGDRAVARGGPGGPSGAAARVPLIVGGLAPWILTAPTPPGWRGVAAGKGGDATAACNPAGSADALGGVGATGAAPVPARVPPAASPVVSIGTP